MNSLHSKRYNKFIRHIVKARTENKITQQELALILGKPQSYVSKYERSERRLDVIEFLDIIAALKITPDIWLQLLKDDLEK